MRLERQIFSTWFQWLTSPDEQYRGQFHGLLREVDDALARSGGPFFLGEKFSLIDILFVPFMERMAASLPYYKGLLVRGNDAYPRVQQWFAALDQRETYKGKNTCSLDFPPAYAPAGMKSDYYTHCHDLPPQIGRCFSAAEAKVYEDIIDGKGRSWQVPVPVERTDAMEVLLSSPEEARREAANSLISNHEAVVRFACRALGTPGFPPVSAPLADPYSTPNEAFIDPVSAALRHVAHSLLVQSLDSVPVSTGLPKAEVRLALEYLRERVGVPRDMSLHAALYLRAHLNWMIQVLD
jgi:glutathione S-transferase